MRKVTSIALLFVSVAAALSLAALGQQYGYFPPSGITYTPTNGMVLGAATGGQQGLGTVNATGIFLNGAPVSAGQQPTNVPLFKVQPSDATNSTGTGSPNNTTSLQFVAANLNAAGVYSVYCWIFYTTAAATTFQFTLFTSGTTTGIGHVSDGLNIVGGASINTYQAATTNTFLTGNTQTVAGELWLEEVINYTTGAGNSVNFNFATGTGGNTVTLKAGSWCELQKIG